MIEPRIFGGQFSADRAALIEEVTQALGRPADKPRPESEPLPRLSRPWPGIGSPVTRSEIARAKRSIGLGSPGIWDTIVSSIKKDWKWWLGGSIAVILAVAVAASGGRKK